jgi:deoxycytidylate deaminase
MNWKEYFRGIAHQVKLKSKDRYTQIGAVVVGSDNQIVSTGYNSFPRGIDASILMIVLMRDKKDLKSIIGLNTLKETHYTMQH